MIILFQFDLQVLSYTFCLHSIAVSRYSHDMVDHLIDTVILFPVFHILILSPRDNLGKLLIQGYTSVGFRLQDQKQAPFLNVLSIMARIDSDLGG